jgi:hypothetical protein
MKKKMLAALLISCSFAVFSAETTDLPESREVPPPPVVSDLQASLTGTSVKLDWTPAPGVEGENIILRAERPITAANYTSAERRGTVPAGTGTFTDTVTESAAWYYAILTRDRDGTYYDFFLPASNSLLVPVQSVAAIPVQAAVFSGFDAMTRNDAVIVTWKASVKNRNLVLYRSTAPFVGLSSLVQAVVVSTFKDDGTPWVDYPVPGVPDYYAVLDDDTLRTGTATFSEGGNTNRIPVEVPAMYEKAQRERLATLRPMPLPWLNPSSEPEIPAAAFSRQTEAKIAELIKGSPPAKASKAREPYIFRSDRNGTGIGEEFTLRTILEKNFSSASWDRAISALTEFLAIRRTDDTTARAHFYIGEALYLKGEYRKALPEFLLAEDLYYNQSREWIEYTLTKMTE